MPTSVVPALTVFDPACVVEVAAGESLSLIADRFDDDTVTVPAIRTENGVVGDNIDPGDYLDVCVANGLNDITGEQRTEADAVAIATLAAVEAQQRQLNALFAGLGTPELLVDGISGPVTRQRLCAARLALGLPVSTADMLAGSSEEQMLMAATTLPIPFTSAILSERWILIDQTCQIMFVGEGTTRLTFVFPTSTGEPGHETRDQDRSRAFRFNPALGNGGWHNSTIYPAANDNPLNGNMYKPIYFDRGQAIHGANNVPTNPQSKGCARLRVEHQEILIGWLGLGDVTSEIGTRDRINVTVNVQGTYVPA
ncbi:MAG: L,D-transpeptidase family protein [Acidimicrobiia bacterium]